MKPIEGVSLRMRSFVRRSADVSKYLLIVAVIFITLPQAANGASQVPYVALGDSLAFGAFAPIGRGYVPLYKNFFEADTGISAPLVNLGIPGWTSYELVNALRSNFFFRLAVFSAGIVTWDVGGNDLTPARNSYKAGTCGGGDNKDCLRAAVAAFKTNWDGILTEIFRLRRFRPTILRTMEIYNPFVNVDKASDSWLADGGATDFEALKPFLDEVNAYINSASRGVPVAHVYAAFNGPLGDVDPSANGLISFDGFHPNGSGHALIANLIRNLGYTTITP
jgi:lysophospholipase L1-like esterase